jgi:hypothetical protein
MVIQVCLWNGSAYGTVYSDSTSREINIEVKNSWIQKIVAKWKKQK